jgi:hypothetical protein
LADQLNSGPNSSFFKRLVLSLFFALVACGTLFYLITFLGLMVEVFRGPLNPANTPGFSSALKHVLLPLSLAVGTLTFFLTFAWRRVSAPPWPGQKLAPTQRKHHP